METHAHMYRTGSSGERDSLQEFFLSSALQIFDCNSGRLRLVCVSFPTRTCPSPPTSPLPHPLTHLGLLLFVPSSSSSDNRERRTGAPCFHSFPTLHFLSFLSQSPDFHSDILYWCIRHGSLSNVPPHPLKFLIIIYQIV